MSNPTVLDGMRAPRSVRLEDIRRAEPDTAGVYPVAAASPGITVYVSKYRRYLVEVQNVPSYTHEGRRYPAKRIAAQFDEGVYRNDDRDPKVRALIDETLQSNRYFGIFGSMADFWLASEQQAMTEAKRIQAAMDTLKSLPRDVVERHMAQLQHGPAEDHALPPLDATSPATDAVVGKASLRPIPPTSSAQ